MLHPESIRRRHGIASRDPPVLPGILCHRHHAMREQPAFPAHEHEVSDLHLILIHPLDDQRVSWPNGGEHAPAGRRKTKRPEPTQHLCRKFAL